MDNTDPWAASRPQRSESERINDQLNSLFMTYDTKTLTIMLLIKAGGALQNLYSLGIWKADAIKGMIEEAFKNACVQLPEEKLPKISTVGMSSGKAN